MTLTTTAFVPSSSFIPSLTSLQSHLSPFPLKNHTQPTASTRLTMGGTPFRKYHGLGNDFILIDNRSTTTPVFSPSQAEILCDRHRGVGADGVIFLLPAQEEASDCAMRLYNADGSEPEMCGNGIRCLARFAADVGHSPRTPGRLVVDTLAGPIVPELRDTDVCVDMGTPILTPADVPTTLRPSADTGFVDILSNVAGRDWEFACVSMGNPHAITFVDADTMADTDANLESIGPLFENHAVFPQRTNTEFVLEKSRTEFDMLVWERGSGRTMACGTGACAVLVAAVLTGRADRDVPTTINLPGGPLVIEWRTGNDHVLMTGPAELVFEGTLSNF